MKTGLFFIPLAGLLLANAAQAAVCQNVNGAPTTVDYDLSTTLTAAQNAAGNTVQLTKNQEVNVQAVCPAGSALSNRTYRSYVSPYAVVETSGPWKYLKLDPDYLEGAMRIDDSAAGTLYLPTNYAYMGTDDSVNAGKPFYIRDSNLVFQLKIARPFVGTVTITPKTMFNVYVTTGTSDPLSNVVYNIAYSGTVTVPQSCEINAGQTILVDFGSLYSGGFNRAGAKPVSVRNKKFRVPVKCSGVNSQVNLSLRLIATADTHLNQAIASDNPDVGVVVETNDGAVLTPNDASSVVPFVTDDAGKANIALQAYPVSTTGEIPAEGVFTALANLRVDFD
ncbi:fimbrial protein BcfD [Klebsiella oxytoca]|uniref:fimbrial protein BcfD n=1 Tax=Klebsiella TaxID=570 RepID=UPI0013D436CD|nr:fimbrial protein BcfD [Klebsiella oxytoca]EKH6436958.1 fimbrial protein BcfD [Klebsiella oxytoca]EKJ7587778.1 fimbrial protein BcfD [Klebsiella oxytoca]EKU6743810.1 fimbrial protein BcfD [Klebsiella oxytoca]EKU7139661.1 fimbrial protein BcfD [Klebsiella oxytoca]EKV0269399.1 fimbrial protein BcfD [Klebsiella oxytoca]